LSNDFLDKIPNAQASKAKIDNGMTIAEHRKQQSRWTFPIKNGKKYLKSCI
jgi:hypothetical protein